MNPSDEDPPPVLVRRTIPTDPAVRSSESLFLTETSGQAGTPSRKLLFSGTSSAPILVAERMRVEPGKPLITRRRLMLIDGVPVRLATSYFPTDAPEAEELSGNSFLEGGLQALFDRHGRRFGRAEETLTARMPAAEEAELLDVGNDEPVVEIVRTSYDDRGTAVHTLLTVCVASRHIFKVTQPPHDSVF